jgi:single-strand DNA-binding protein
VVATGRLRARTWEADDGTKRATVEMTVDDVGPSLRRAVAKVTKATREHASGDAPTSASNGKAAASAAAATFAAGAADSASSFGVVPDDKPPF